VKQTFYRKLMQMKIKLFKTLDMPEGCGTTYGRVFEVTTIEKRNKGKIMCYFFADDGGMCTAFIDYEAFPVFRDYESKKCFSCNRYKECMRENKCVGYKRKPKNTQTPALMEELEKLEELDNA